MTRSVRRALALGLAAVIATLASGCGSDDAAQAESNAPLYSLGWEHNNADVEFAQMMIPHHLLALDMVRIASRNAAAGRIVRFNSAIYGSQDREIAFLRQWLEQWGADPAPGDHPIAPHLDVIIYDYPHHHGSTPMGMHDRAAMEKLLATTGLDFDTLYLNMMIDHHAGAVAMASDVLEHGKSERVRRMARDIVRVQSDQIQQMRKMLATPPDPSDVSGRRVPF